MILKAIILLKVWQGFCYVFYVVFIGNERVVVMRNPPVIEYDDTESWVNVDDFMIWQYRWLEDGSINVVTRGQHRFRLKLRWIEVDGKPSVAIQIIEEGLSLRTPRDVVG
ncbi:cereblon like protein, partial [Tanacetum coccineum]